MNTLKDIMDIILWVLYLPIAVLIIPLAFSAFLFLLLVNFILNDEVLFKKALLGILHGLGFEKAIELDEKERDENT